MPDNPGQDLPGDGPTAEDIESGITQECVTFKVAFNSMRPNFRQVVILRARRYTKFRLPNAPSRRASLTSLGLAVTGVRPQLSDDFEDRLQAALVYWSKREDGHRVWTIKKLVNELVGTAVSDFKSWWRRRRIDEENLGTKVPGDAPVRELDFVQQFRMSVAESATAGAMRALELFDYIHELSQQPNLPKEPEEYAITPVNGITFDPARVMARFSWSPAQFRAAREHLQECGEKFRERVFRQKRRAP